MKNMILILLATAMLACSPGKENSLSENTSEQSATATQNLASVPQSDLYSDPKTKLIKTVDYKFKVDDVKKSTEAIEASVKKFPAYFSSSSLSLENDYIQNKIIIRVQNDFFQDLLKEIDKQAVYVHFRNVSTSDVSKDFVDLESRLKTKREVEGRYTEILRKKAGTIKELLDAEKQIGELHEEIEATISRLNYLKDQVSYSTINLEFYQSISTPAVASNNGIGHAFLDAFSAGLTGLLNLLVGLAYIWPLVILLTVGFVLYKKKAKNFKSQISS